MSRIGVRVRIVKDGPLFRGFATVTFPNGKCLLLQARVDQRPIVASVMRRTAPVAFGYWERMSEIGAVDKTAEIGFFRAFGKFVKGATKRLAQAKVIKQVMGGIKKIVRDPVIAKMVGLASFIPVVGPILGAARAIDDGLTKVADAARRGNLAAQGIVRAVAKNAAKGNPHAINTAAAFAKALSA